MGNKVTIAPGFYILFAISLLMVPLRWVIGAILAAFMHELFHCIAILLCKGQILSVSFGAFGARIQTSPVKGASEVLGILAGPAGSFSMLLITEYFPEAALCGLIQGGYNLLPVYPLDGGRLVKCLMPHSLCVGVQAFTLFMLSGLSIWLMTYHAGFGMILLVSLWIPVLQRKIACKGSVFAVQ